MTTKDLIQRLERIKDISPQLKNKDVRAIEEAIERLEEDVAERVEDEVIEARREGVEIAIEWLDIKQEHERDFDKDIDANRLAIDADHSFRGGLLEWMIKGNKPYDEPPPLATSRPWYGIIERGEAKLSDFMVSYFDPEDSIFEEEQFSIGQYRWDVIDKDTDQDPTVYEVTWQNKDDPDSVWELHEETFTQTKWDVSNQEEIEEEVEGWKLSRIGEQTLEPKEDGPWSG